MGLGHSCGDVKSGDCVQGSVLDDALMRAQAHFDGRGPRVNNVCKSLISESYILYPIPILFYLYMI